MATYNNTGVTVTSGVPATTSVPHSGVGKVYLAQQTLDLSAYVTADGPLTVDAIHQVLVIPKNTLVMQVTVVVDTAAVGSTLTADLGDASGDNSWNDAIDIKTAGTYIFSTVGTDAYGSAANMGKFYTAADTIDLVIEASTAITAGPILRVFALCVDYN
jgi:hypothetical protein